MMNQTTPETGEVEWLSRLARRTYKQVSEEVEFATIYSSREQLLPGHDQVL